MSDTHGSLKQYLKETLGGSSTDLTTLVVKRADALTTGDRNQKVFSILSTAGTHN